MQNIAQLYSTIKHLWGRYLAFETQIRLWQGNLLLVNNMKYRNKVNTEHFANVTTPFEVSITYPADQVLAISTDILPNANFTG